MNTKPILLWPKQRSDIAVHLDRGAEYFSVVDTNCAYELQKLYNIKRTTPILDPFPRYGEHYGAFRDHVVAPIAPFTSSGSKPAGMYHGR